MSRRQEDLVSSEVEQGFRKHFMFAFRSLGLFLFFVQNLVLNRIVIFFDLSMSTK